MVHRPLARATPAVAGRHDPAIDAETDPQAAARGRPRGIAGIAAPVPDLPAGRVAAIHGLHRAVGNRVVQRYLQVGKAAYNVADLKTKKTDPLVKMLNAAFNAKKDKPPGADALFAALKDSDITFVFKDESAVEAFLAGPSPKHYTMAMKFDEKKACVAQALALADPKKSAQRWHEEFLASKINYTEDTEVEKALKFGGFVPVPDQSGKIEDVLARLDVSQTYILIGGSKAEMHAMIYRNGKVSDTQGVNPKGVHVNAVYQKK